MLDRIRRRLGLALSPAVLPALMACGASSGEPQAAAATDEYGHVHAMSVIDGDLHLATHHGLFRVARDGTPTRVGTEDHDFMGFTALPDGTLLGSGHPNSRTDLPSHLGLLESSDGGLTWRTRSLAGQADFHALAASATTVYGWNSVTGKLMTSQDRMTWRTVGDTPIADLAVHPTRAGTVLIATEKGPARSTDAAATFRTLPDAPLLLAFAWPTGKVLYGLGIDGDVHRSADSGTTWKQVGKVASVPREITVGPDGGIYLADDAEILVSTDDAATFTRFASLASGS
jgi:hypothetical protein